MKKRIPFIIASVLVTIFIFNNSMRIAELSNNDSKFFSQLLYNIFSFFGLRSWADNAFVIARKSAHIFEFLLQSFMIAGCFVTRYRRRIVYILFFGLLTACTDEYIQLFVPGRAGLVSDIFIDFSGTIAGMLLGALIYRTKK